MRRFIITGCSRGLGLALTQAAIDDGGRVAGLARHQPAPLDDRGRFSLIEADMTDSCQLHGKLAHALTALGSDRSQSLTLINNAGVVTPMVPAGDYAAEEVCQALAINLTAPILLTNAFLQLAPAFADRLRILNISSGAARQVYPGWGIYGAGKAGLDHFTRHVAAEQARHPHGAQAVALYPGVIDSDMQQTIRAADSDGFPMKPRFDALKRDGALASPAETARRILDYLESEAFGTEPVLDIRTL